MIQYAHQLDSTLPQDKSQLQKLQLAEKQEVVQAASTATQGGPVGPTMPNATHMNNSQMHNQLQPQDLNDEKMHIEREEDETTMGEGVVAVEGETTKDGKELPVVV